MSSHPPHPRLAHRLPPAPHFVGRDAELAALRALRQSDFRGVVALVGLGGAGKTAVAARFLDELLDPQAGPRPDGLFVWSFYQEPDAGLFLREAYHYFSRGGATAAKGAGLLHLLREALGEGGPHWLVLDGLERVQRQESTGGYGQVEDPLLKGLLTRLAEGGGNATVLVTSRFPLTDLAPFAARDYRQLDVGGLDRAAAGELLRAHGVQGDDDALAGLIDGYGAHALTLDHLGTLLGQFLGGDPGRAPELPALTAPVTDRQALRLARLLRAYEEHLPPEELALLCRLCLLRRSVTEEQITKLFCCEPAVHLRMVRELHEVITRFWGMGDLFEEDELADLAASLLSVVEEALCAAPLAGPEDAFRREVHGVIEGIYRFHKERTETNLDELTRRYRSAAQATPTERLPLSAEDRRNLCTLYDRYVELKEHSSLSLKEPPSVLAKAFQNLGYGRRVVFDVSPADAVHALRRAEWGLIYLAAKHFALQRLHELCRLARQKWALAGPLATLDAAALRRVLDALVGRHLVLREAEGTYGVHPAVRDHFARLAEQVEGGAWHDVLRGQLVSLVQRPGRRPPEDAATLDLVEEAIHHALQAGRADEALSLYQHTLGGLRHLGWKLGEMARGLRILRSFEPCPDPWALAWYLRALGELDEAARHCGLAYFRADLLLLQGRLPEVAAIGDSTRTPVAEFLMGRTTALPPDQLGGAVPREQLLLYLGRLDGLRRSALLERFYGDIGWEGDRARCQLLLAEAAHRQRDAVTCSQHLDAAARWILHAGSVEHLGLFHLLRARVARDAAELDAAGRAVDEGLHVARQCGLGLYLIELLCEQAQVFLARGDAPVAEASAREALQRASAPACQFQWGAGEAGHLLGLALIAQNRTGAAVKILGRTLSLRCRIGDPQAAQTEQLLARRTKDR